MTEKIIRVYWWDHGIADCSYITKYCEEFHRKSALIPVDVLRKYAAGVK